MSRAFAAFVVASLAAASLAALVFWARLPGSQPTDDDYRAANDFLAERVKDGDIVVLAPTWAERGRAFLTAAPVHAGYDLARDEYPGTRRQWLVALPAAPRFRLEEAREALNARARSSGDAQRFGGLWVERFDIAGPPVAFSFTDRVADAEVTLSGRACEQTRPGFHQCPRGQWNNVHAQWYEVDERPMHCLWAHPVAGSPLRIRYRNVPAGARVRGRAALVGQSGTAENGAPVTLALVAEGRKVGEVQAQNRVGPQPFSFDLPDAASELVFEVTTPDQRRRHFCFDAWLEPPAPPIQATP